uniref:NR LBD domain-containing protein n=1 Tax=Haemonchus placei TaxID=6290 RepID=A0A0N4VXR1_HAEPC
LRWSLLPRQHLLMRHLKQVRTTLKMRANLTIKLCLVRDRKWLELPTVPAIEAISLADMRRSTAISICNNAKDYRNVKFQIFFLLFLKFLVSLLVLQTFPFASRINEFDANSCQKQRHILLKTGSSSEVHSINSSKSKA